MRSTRSSSILVIAILLAGCGGGGSSSGSNSPTRGGHVGFTVTWPAQARFIPVAATYIRVVVSGPTPGVLEFSSSDVSAGGGSVTKTLTGVQEEGAYTVVASAYASVHPLSESPITSENPLSEGTQSPLQVVAGQTSNTNVVLAQALSQFRVSVTDLIEGGAQTVIGVNALTLGSSLRPSSVYRVSVGAQNAGSGDLVLFPASANRTVLTAPAGFDNITGSPMGSSLTALLVPKTATATATSGVLGVAYTDGSASLFASVGTSLAAVSPALDSTILPTSFDQPALSVSKEFSYGIVRPTISSVPFQLIKFPSTVVAVLGVAGPYVLATAGDVPVYGVVGSSQVTVSGVPTPRTVASGLSALAAYRAASGTANYAVSASGGALTFTRIALDGTVTTLGGSPNALATPSGFAAGYDPDTADVAFYTIEDSSGTNVVRRYTLQSSSYALDASFTAAAASTTAPVDVAVDGNLVGVLKADGSVIFLNSRGETMGASTGLNTGDMAVRLSMANGRGVISYVTAGTYSIRAFDY